MQLFTKNVYYTFITNDLTTVTTDLALNEYPDRVDEEIVEYLAGEVFVD